MSFVLAHLFETAWDGFMPLTVEPLNLPGVTS